MAQADNKLTITLPKDYLFKTLTCLSYAFVNQSNANEQLKDKKGLILNLLVLFYLDENLAKAYFEKITSSNDISDYFNYIIDNNTLRKLCNLSDLNYSLPSLFFCDILPRFTSFFGFKSKINLFIVNERSKEYGIQFEIDNSEHVSMILKEQQSPPGDKLYYLNNAYVFGDFPNEFEYKGPMQPEKLQQLFESSLEVNKDEKLKAFVNKCIEALRKKTEFRFIDYPCIELLMESGYGNQEIPEAPSN